MNPILIPLIILAALIPAEKEEILLPEGYDFLKIAKMGKDLETQIEVPACDLDGDGSLDLLVWLYGGEYDGSYERSNLAMYSYKNKEFTIISDNFDSLRIIVVED